MYKCMIFNCNVFRVTISYKFASQILSIGSIAVEIQPKKEKRSFFQ